MIPLFKPNMPQDLIELNKILYSGKLAYSFWGLRFEEALSEFIGNTRVCTINSYSNAISVALTTLELKPGDEIIASPMSCLASNQPLLSHNLKVVWADIDPMTGTLDPDSVTKSITPKTKVILHNHYAGNVGYINEIQKISNDYGIYVIDDAIEAFGSKYKSQFIGSTGSDITIFSFQTVRLPNSIEGGGLSFKDDNFFQNSLIVRDLGIDRKKFRTESGEINKDYDVTFKGYGALMNEINSYIGYKQMDNLAELIQIQKTNGKQWDEWVCAHLKNSVPVKGANESSSNYWVYGLLSNQKETLIDEMKNRGFIASGLHFPNHFYSVFGSKPILAGVEDFYKRYLALPSGWWVKQEEIKSLEW